MTDKKLTDLPEFTHVVGNVVGNWYYLVDISDTTDGPEGTSKKVQLGADGLNAQDVTGEGTTDSNPPTVGDDPTAQFVLRSKSGRVLGSMGFSLGSTMRLQSTVMDAVTDYRGRHGTGTSDSDFDIYLTYDASTRKTSLVPYTATTTELADVSHVVNTRDSKVAGSHVFNTTTNKPVWAVSNADAGVWVESDGTTEHSPV